MTVEFRLRRATSAETPRYAWVEMRCRPLRPSEQAPERPGLVAVTRDISERKAQEAELIRMRDDAESISRAKTQFLANMSHELRTPLNAVIGFSEILNRELYGALGEARYRDYARLIHESGEHLLAVVNDILDMSKLEAGKFELQTEPFMPDTLVEPCFKMVDAMAREKSIRLMSDIPRAVPMLVADERVCRQILINLLSNAIKFSHEHSVITLGMRRQGRYVAIAVTDHGIGMGEEAVRRLGEPFFQAQGGLARRYEGTGLGLSIVKGLVELHEGELHASSTPGEGTVMTVLLPINGPETKVEETAAVTPLHREPAQQQMPTWPADERKRAL
jgi:cell cycle sensor histidine kinase DivJ